MRCSCYIVYMWRWFIEREREKERVYIVLIIHCLLNVRFAWLSTLCLCVHIVLNRDARCIYNAAIIFVSVELEARYTRILNHLKYTRCT